MWTGDVAPHDIWNVTRHEVISQMKLVTNLIKQYARVPVYPVIGNHEGVPVNRFVLESCCIVCRLAAESSDGTAT